MKTVFSQAIENTILQNIEILKMLFYRILKFVAPGIFDSLPLVYRKIQAFRLYRVFQHKALQDINTNTNTNTNAITHRNLNTNTNTTLWFICVVANTESEYLFAFIYVQWPHWHLFSFHFKRDVCVPCIHESLTNNTKVVDPNISTWTGIRCEAAQNLYLWPSFWSSC